MMQVFAEVLERFPNNNLTDYLIFDLETTGFDPLKCRILEVGYRSIKNGMQDKPISGDFLIKTPYDPITWSAVYALRNEKSNSFLTMIRKAGKDIDTIKKAIDENDGSIYGLECIPDEIKEMMDHRSRPYFTTAVDVHKIKSSRTLAEGKDREEVLNVFANVLEAVFRNNMLIVGHNNFRLDVPFMLSEIKQFCGRDVKVNLDNIIDTGLLVKAHQCNMRPAKKESLSDFYKRIESRRSKCQWTLDGYCFEAFNLATYGVDPNMQHQSAKYDCFVNNCLLLEMKKRAQC